MGKLKEVFDLYTISDGDWFSLLREISLSIKSESVNDQVKGRDALVRLLDNWDCVANDCKIILKEIISSAGFYPYLRKIESNLNAGRDLAEEIRCAYHESDNLNDIVLHSEQKEILQYLYAGRNVVVSAPTSFGKSLLIEEIVASKIYKNIVIIQPTLALLDETRQKLLKYSEEYKIILKSSQKRSTDKGNLFLLTAERVIESEEIVDIDLLVVDEFYKLSTQRGDTRSTALNMAFIKVMKNTGCKFYLLGPCVDGVSKRFIEKYNALHYKSNFSMLISEEENIYKNLSISLDEKGDQNELFELLDSLDDSTLIYCSSPSKARGLAFAFADYLSRQNRPVSEQLAISDWISTNIDEKWSMIESLKYSIGVHDGAMPKYITSAFIRYFNEKRIKYLFCTNTIIEGVNTSAKNVIFFDSKVGNRRLDYFDYANIKGRAGRLMQHYVGVIYNFKEPPHKEKVIVDIPFVDQNPVNTEILVNLNYSDVLDIGDNIKRYSDFLKNKLELQDILKRNAVSIEGQLNIVERLNMDLQDPVKRRLILCNCRSGNIYETLGYIIELCHEYIATKEERRSYGASLKSIIYNLNSIFIGKTVGDLIQNKIQYRLEEIAKREKLTNLSRQNVITQCPKEAQVVIDSSIQEMFAFQKNWIQYRAPKWINVMDTLQKYVSNENGIPSGDYSYISDAIENFSLRSRYKFLLEFGLPVSTIRIIESVIDPLIDQEKIEDQMIDEDFLFNYIAEKIDLIKAKMSAFENEILDNVIYKR